MDDYIGIIKIFAGSYAPRGWAFCNGQLLAIQTNPALFSILGTTYGGNGSTTFALPDLRSRVPVHAGQGNGLSNYTLGEQRGSENTTLLVTNMPAHTHPVTASMAVNNASADLKEATTGASIASPGIQVSRNFEGTLGFNTQTPNVQVSGLSVNVGVAGGSQPVSIVQPSLGINYIICLEGPFPPRD